MKKIAFVIKLFQSKNFHGGGEKLFCKLIKGFISKNYVIDVYCSKSDVSDFTGINGIFVVDVEYDHLKPKTMEKFYDKVRLLTSDKNYDFIISENITPPIGITFLQGHSLIHRKRQYKSFLKGLLYYFRPVKRERIKYQAKWMGQGYNKIFAPSNIVKQEIIKNFGIGEDKIFAVYPGVDIDEAAVYKPVKPVGNPVTFGLSAPGFKIKGGFVFLKALHLLKKQGLDFRAKIIYPKYKKNLGVKLLLKFYGIEKNVEFLSFQENMQNFYNSVNCIVMPSIEDTFGLVALEAMANKRFCIISSNAGASEIIEQGKNGFVFRFDSDKEKNLADVMAKFILNPQINFELCENAFQTAQNYSWDRMFNEFLNLLKI